MNIDQAISQLEKAKASGAKNIVFAFWEAECFEMEDNQLWEEATNHIDKRMDWSRTNDDISDMIGDVYIETVESTKIN